MVPITRFEWDYVSLTAIKIKIHVFLVRKIELNENGTTCWNEDRTAGEWNECVLYVRWGIWNEWGQQTATDRVQKKTMA